MRRRLRDLGSLPDNFGLAYEVFGPVDDHPDYAKRREAWLEACAVLPMSDDYGEYFRTWELSFASDGATSSTWRATLTSRLLVGLGNPSASEVGLTVHRAWGVPMIPGSALKGLAATFAETVYGNEQKWRGPVWDGLRISRAPGDYHAALFGAPAADLDEAAERQGLVVFHDALYAPSAPGEAPPFARDVLTVHQPEYYNHQGGGEHWPSDWDSPNPVSFISVRAGVQLLMAISGPVTWRALAEQLLREALADWGAGAKTSLGYGRAE